MVISDFYLTTLKLKEPEYLSYFIDKSFLNSRKAYKLIRNYNDSYHKNHSGNKDYLSFCIVKTIFTNDESKHYVFIEDLGRNK